MPVTITIPTPLRQFADGQSEIQIDARTAGEALDKLTSTHSELRRHLFNDQNALRNFVNVYVNDEDIRHANGPDTPVKEGDTILIVPSIAGGAAVLDEIAGKDTGVPQAEMPALPMLSNEEVARYSRHLIMPEVGMTGQRKLKAASVLMIGTGGLGAPLGMYLAAAGVGRLGLVDFDVVFASKDRPASFGPSVARAIVAFILNRRRRVWCPRAPKVECWGCCRESSAQSRQM